MMRLARRAFSAASRRKFEGLFASAEDPFRYGLEFEKRRFALMIGMIREYQNKQTTTSAPLLRNGLEVACAEGALTERLAPLCRSLTALDISETALRRAAGRVGSAGPNPHVSFVQADLLDWQPQAGAYDLVVASEVLYYLGERNDLLRVLGLSRRLLGAALERLARAAAPGGLVLLAHSYGPGGRAGREAYRSSLENLGLGLVREEDVPPTGEPGTDSCLVSLLKKP